MFLFTGEAPKLPEPIQIVIEQKIEEPEIKEEDTLQYKIDNDVNNCEPERYIRADNAECGAIRPEYRVSEGRSTTQSTNSQVSQEKAPTRPVRSSSGNTYTYGYCTWYVKNTLGWVPNGLGNANTWASRASAMGYTVSSTPTVGSVAQTSGGPLGHVAVVTAVNGNTVTISEMNYNGWGVVNSRVAPISSFVYIR